jgi:hypothetical protein
MKASFLTLVLIGLLGCAEQQECAAPPTSITFRLEDANGTDISSQFANGLSIVYDNNGKTGKVDVKTTVSQGNTSYFSYFPSLAGGGVSDFQLALNDGRSFPIAVTLSGPPSGCASPTIQRLVFNTKVVSPDNSIQPTTYRFQIN